MNAAYVTRELAAATTSRDAALAALAACKPGSRRWFAAEEDLNFWQGKVANLEAAAR